MHINWINELKGIYGENKAMFITCKATGMMLYYFLISKKESGNFDALKRCIQWLQKRYTLKISMICSDNELAKGMVTRKWLEKSGITFEPSPSYTQDFNGVSERTRGVIFMKERCMRVQARLPHKLWREVINAAVYLYNRTPRAKNRWATLYTLFHGYLGERDGIKGSYTPETAHLKAYGCVAYAATTTYKRGLSKLRKLDPRADVGYLVGYDSTNIYRVWIPHQGRVIFTRDVIFDESKFFNSRKKQITTLEILELDDLI
jgi:hypothetical protein